MKPTLDFYNYLQTAFDFFNERLFDNKLSPVMFTITRKKRVCGYFRNNAWVSENGDEVHEIAVNPAYFITASPLEIYQTLCHEMCHQAIFEFGKPSRGGYHSLEWANTMINIGLMPVAKNGGITGQSVGDKPIPGGKFEQCCIEFFLAGYKLAMVDKQYSSNITLKRLNAAIEERINTAASLAVRIDTVLYKAVPSFDNHSNAPHMPTLANSDGDSDFDSPVVNEIYEGDHYEEASTNPNIHIALTNDSNVSVSTFADHEDVSEAADTVSLNAYDAINYPIHEFFDISSIKDRPDSPIKTCYQCPECKYKLWGRKNIKVGCLTCGSELITVKEGT